MFPELFSSLTHSRLVRRFLIFALLIVWLLPLLGVVSISLRSMEELNQGNYWGLPTFTDGLQNYIEVFRSPQLIRFILNSLVISAGATAGAIIMAAMAGFALAQYDFRGSNVILAVFIGGNLMPFQSLMIPVREIIVWLDLYDTRSGLILFHIAFQTGFCTLFIRNFFRQVPRRIIESARTEGASEFQIFIHIALPLLRPVLAGLAALVFTFVWNDFFWSLVLAHSDHVRPLTAGLQSLRGMWAAQWHLMAAASLIAAVPPVVLFLVLQRQFVRILYRPAAPQ